MNEEIKRQGKKMVKESEIFASCTFSSLGLHSTLCDQLRDKMGFEVPTLVQAQAIPAILSGRHVLVNAATGTGKTVAYLAPIIHHLQKSERRIQRADGTIALVLVPTRELCMQVYETLQKLLQRYHWIVPGYITGGESRSKEKARLRKGISILVATPGRLLDHLKKTSSFLYSNLHWIVFDEADRIFELGCGKEIAETLEHLGSKKNISVNKDNATPSFEFPQQNLLLSATLNEKVNHFAKISLENPIMIGLGGGNNSLEVQPSKHSRFLSEDVNEAQPIEKEKSFSSASYTIPTQLIQRYVQAPCGSRLSVLFSVLKYMLESESFEKILVLFSTCDAVDFHYSLFGEFQFPPSSQSGATHENLFLKCKIFRLHGSMKPEDRRTTFQAFKSEKLALLLSTDIAARGLDFPKVRCIIQYDPPGEALEYVHRVGRTARLGERGDSLLFLQPTEIDYLQDLQNHGVSLTEYPLVKVLDSFSVHGRKQQFAPKFASLESHSWVMLLQKAVESFILAEAGMLKLAQKAFCSWVRAYTAHRGELKKIFVVKKLHLGHVAKSFALKQQPSAVLKSYKKKHVTKRKRDVKQPRDISSSSSSSKRKRM